MFCTTECWDCEDYECKYSMEIEEKNKLQQDNKQLKDRINKAIHLINHNDIMHYSVFEEELLEILKGDSDV